MELTDPTPEELKTHLAGKSGVSEPTRDEYTRHMRDRGPLTRAWDRVTEKDIKKDPQSLSGDKWEYVPREVPIIAGSLAGMWAGSKLPGPAGAVGSIAGGAIGAGAGAVVPEGVMEGLEYIGFLPEGYREEHGLSNEELKTIAMGEALVDVILGGGFAGVGMARRVGARVLTGMGRAETAIADQLAEHGVDLAPHVAGGSKVSRMFTSVMGRFPIIGAPFIRQATKTSEQFGKVLDELPRGMGELLRHSRLSEILLDRALKTVRGVGASFNRRYTKLFKEADELGVHVAPKHMFREVDKALKEISDATPVPLKEGVEQAPSASHQAVLDFVEKHLSGFSQRFDEGRAVQWIPLGQFDGLIKTIDDEISRLSGERGNAHAVSMLRRVRVAALGDVHENLVAADRAAAKEIGASLRALDSEFSEVQKLFFESATAVKFATVHKYGLRGVGFDRQTSTHAQKLYKIIMDLEVPATIDELGRLVGRHVMSDVGAVAMEDVLRKSADDLMATGGKAYNLGRIRKAMGLDSKTSSRYQTFEKILSRSGGLNIKEVGKILDGAERFLSTEIPNVSTFIARRAQIGGMRGAVRAFSPRVTGSGVLGHALGVLLTIGGGNMVARMMTDPMAAQSLRRVASKTVARSQQKATVVRLTRQAIDYAVNHERIDVEMGNELREWLNEDVVGMLEAINPIGPETTKSIGKAVRQIGGKD